MTLRNVLCLIVIPYPVDNTPPTLTCPSDRTVTVELGVSSTVINFITPSATDISGPVTLLEATHQSNFPFPVGSTTVRYTFADSSGNQASCQFTITVTEGKLCSSWLTLKIPRF